MDGPRLGDGIMPLRTGIAGFIRSGLDGRRRWEPDRVRVLFSTTANDGHFGPMAPFALACADAGHEVRVAAPASYAPALRRVGLTHEPFPDAPPEQIGPVMARLPQLSFEDANDVVVKEVFGRIDAQAALPGLVDVIQRWRPDTLVRESAELSSLVAAERFGIPHVQVAIGMHEVADRFAQAVHEPLAHLAQMVAFAGDPDAALAAEPMVSVIPEALDFAAGTAPLPGPVVHRFRPPASTSTPDRPAAWGDPDRPLLYVTFGSVAGSLPAFSGVFREALDALAGLDATVVMTTGRQVDVAGIGPVPPNAVVAPWLPQEQVLAHAAAMLGHGGLGTTLGAVAAGVPQVVAPLFSFDQVVNGEHVAAVGAGLTVGPGPGAVTRGAGVLESLMRSDSYAASARRIASAVRELPPASDAVPLLTSP